MRWASFILAGIVPWAMHDAGAGPYAPGPYEANTTALSAGTNLFVAWADGWVDYAPGGDETNDAGYVFTPDPLAPMQALGPADASLGWPYSIVSLGSGGSLTLTFSNGITDGPGFDFAVFENAMLAGFYELAYVEASSDGTNFYRFPCRSLTTDPVGPYEATLDATDLDGLAGKYPAGYGTPFDLADLTHAPNLDVSDVRFIRLVDIAGDGSRLDDAGRPIYDPYPTMGSPGFDLDAIGVIHVPFDLEPAARSAEGLSFSVQTYSNRAYQLQWTDSLVSGDWHEATPAITGSGTTTHLTDTTPAAPTKIYRIVETIP